MINHFRAMVLVQRALDGAYLVERRRDRLLPRVDRISFLELEVDNSTLLDVCSRVEFFYGIQIMLPEIWPLVSLRNYEEESQTTVYQLRVLLTKQGTWITERTGNQTLDWMHCVELRHGESLTFETASLVHMLNSEQLPLLPHFQ